MPVFAARQIAAHVVWISVVAADLAPPEVPHPKLDETIAAEPEHRLAAAMGAKLAEAERRGSLRQYAPDDIDFAAQLSLSSRGFVSTHAAGLRASLELHVQFYEQALPVRPELYSRAARQVHQSESYLFRQM